VNAAIASDAAIVSVDDSIEKRLQNQQNRGQNVPNLPARFTLLIAESRGVVIDYFSIHIARKQ
jgi:hypothetical protein